MDQSFISYVQRPDSHYTQVPSTQTPSRTQTHTATHTSLSPEQPRQQPPSKRRRANSVSPFVTAPAAPTAPTNSTTHDPQPFSPSPRWHTQPTRAVDDPEPVTETLSPRNPSPDRVSRVSATSSLHLGGPQLRKKPKSSSIKDTNRYSIASTISKSPSTSALYPASQTEQESTHLSTSNHGGTAPSISRANSSSSQHLSPNQKRPPASHSSYGVETTCGPPPSYSTQRTLSQERIRKPDRGAQPRMQLASDSPYASTLDDANDTAGTNKKERATSIIHSSPDTADTHSVLTPTESDNMSNIRIRGDNGTSTEEEGKASSSDERRSEDLFLNIAQSDAARPPYSKTEKKRSRISIPFLSNSRPAQPSRSSPVQPHYEPSTVLSPRADVKQYHSKRASIGGQMPSASLSRSHLVENNRTREHLHDLPAETDRVEITTHSRLGRRASTANPESTRLSHRSSAGLRNNRLVSESVYPDRPKTGEQIATESTVSTTAPSTVWDELDDLKSRIRKLELTGKLPPSSAAAMGVTERPRTATTAATTMSTSPKYKPSETNLQSTIEGVPSSIHPLLHEALGNAKSTLSSDVYQKLQATAQDALQLAGMANSEGSGSRNYPASHATDRQIRRRTESLCRSLTELAIALAGEAKPTQANVRPASRDQSLPPNSMLRSRRYSNDPGDRGALSSRVQSRLDSRRTSVHLHQGVTGNTSPEHNLVQSPSAYLPASDSRVGRASTLLRKRGQGSFDGADDPIDASPSVRPASRAVTELGAYRRISRDQLQGPREYTSQQPLPHRAEQTIATNTPLTSSSSTNLTSRRKYASPTSVVGMPDNAPTTPRETWGRILIVADDTATPEAASEGRVGSTRRSMGFAGRIGSSVGSRLRAARAERNSREHGGGELAATMQGDENTTGAAVDDKAAAHA